MAKVITFSKKFPSYHPAKGEPTYFVEKFLKSFDSPELRARVFDHKAKIGPVSYKVFEECLPKHHTVRVGRRWKEGDYFSPRVWSGRPYFDPQITIAPDTLIVKTYDILIKPEGTIWYNHHYFGPGYWHFDTIAQNDGLTPIEFYEWLIAPVVKKGIQVEAQIICWHDVNYDQLFDPF